MSAGSGSASPTRAAAAGRCECRAASSRARGHRRQGDRAAAAGRVLRAGSRGSTPARRASTPRRADCQPEVLRRGRRGQRRSDSGRGCARCQGRRARRRRVVRARRRAPMKEIRWHARAGQGAKTASQLFATAHAAFRASSCRRSPSTGPSAAVRRSARTRASTSARFAGTIRSRIRTSSSCSSPR